MTRRGFTLVELLIGMILVGLVGGAIYQVLVNSQRVYTLQTERAGLNANNRAVVAVLPAELRELDASDAMASDIIAMSATAVTYKAMRSLFFVCQPPVDNDHTGTVELWRNRSYGLRPQIDAGRDSVFIFAEGALNTRMDNAWLHANVSSVSMGNTCPSGAPGITLQLDGVEPGHGLASVRPGSPVRTFEMVRVTTYTDALGDLWLGAQTYTKSGGWSTTQPLLGPLEAPGLQLVYRDSLGNTTATPADVSRIELTVNAQTARPVRGSAGLQPATDTLVTDITLRNNRW